MDKYKETITALREIGSNFEDASNPVYQDLRDTVRDAADLMEELAEEHKRISEKREDVANHYPAEQVLKEILEKMEKEKGKDYHLNGFFSVGQKTFAATAENIVEKALEKVREDLSEYRKQNPIHALSDSHLDCYLKIRNEEQLAIQVAEEAAELVQAISKVRRLHIKNVPVPGEVRANLVTEIAHIHMAVDSIAYLWEVDPEQVNQEIDRTIARFYGNPERP